LQRQVHIRSAPLDLTLKGVIVLVQRQLPQRLILEHHRPVVLVQNGLKLRAVLVGLDHLGDTPGPRHQILCPFFLHSADLQAADLLLAKASPALFAVTLLVGDRPIQPLLFGADLAGVTEHHAQRHNSHFPKVAPVVISAPNAAINQSD
ncbi:HTH-type transcriptional regulator immR, partial [Dysosmobacter welbionis]